MRRCRCLAVLVLIACAAFGEETNLVRQSVVPVPGLTPGNYNDIACSAQGVVYIGYPWRHASSPPTDGKAVAAIFPDGHITPVLLPERYSDARYWHRFSGSIAAAVDSLYIRISGAQPPTPGVTPVREEHLLRYNTAGQFLSDIPLHLDFTVKRFAAFKSGRIAIEGARVVGTNANKETEYEDVLAILSPEGKVLQTKALPEDSPGEPKLLKVHGEHRVTERDLVLGAMRSGTDGKVFLLRHFPAGPVYVISDTGEMKRIPLQPPTRDSKIEQFGAGNNEFVVVYAPLEPATIGPMVRLNEHTMSIATIARFVHVHDADTGRIRAQYRWIRDPREGFALMVPACAASNAITFLHSGRSGTNLVVLAPEKHTVQEKLDRR